MDRRGFNRLCGALLGGAATLHARTATSTPRAAAGGPWPRSLLVHEDDSPLALEALPPGEAWVFHYPYRTTPCFLLRLERGVAGEAGWPGGIDRDASVVAFSAICSHKMTHPARPISHISYRPDPIEFVDDAGVKRRRAGLISCCSERSVYDPADRARVLSGPAPAPLAAIALEEDGEGGIVAVGSHGEDRYERFLESFGFRLALEHGSSDVRARSGATARAVPAGRYSRQQIRC